MVGPRRNFKPKNRGPKERPQKSTETIDEAEFDPTLDRLDGVTMPTRNLSQKELEEEEEERKRKISKRRRQKKHKHQQKGFDVVAEEEVKFTDRLDQHFSLKGSIDAELDGVNTIHDKHVKYNLQQQEKQKKLQQNDAVKSKRTLDEQVNKNPAKKTKDNKGAYLKSELSASLDILNSLATKAETWASTQVSKEQKKIEFLEAKEQKREERKTKDKLIEAQVLAEVKQKEKEKKQLRREMSKSR